MAFKISEDIKRIELHDSTIDNFDLTSENIELIFDWAKIVDFKEQNLGTLILGKSILKLNGIKSNSVEYENENEKTTLEFSEKLINNLDIISENKSENDNTLRISALLKLDDKYVWTSWTTEFNDFEFTWEKYVTLEEWKNGKLVR